MTKLHKFMHSTTLAVLFLGGPTLLSNGTAFAQTSSQQPDDSAQNKNAGQTADAQPNSKSDLKTTADVRKAIIADKSLSMYAHNVKIITHNGSVTLKGPVKSDQEKQQVNSDAAGAASGYKVIDHLTVKQ